MDGTEVATTEEVPEQEYCYGHPKTPTKLHCSRCDRPICGQCAIPASVGQHCPECVAEARKTVRQPRSALRAGSPMVWAIIIANGVAYALELFFGTTPQGLNEIVARFGSFPPAVADGEWYRLVTAMFLHAPPGKGFGILHILFNMYILSIYGPHVEQAVGRIRFLAMYLVAGLMGSAFSYAFGSCLSLGVGASGAIFGVVGILIVYLYNRRGSAMVQQFLTSMLLFVGLNLALGFSLPGVDNMAHIGGLVGGLGLGLGFDRGHRPVAALPVQIAMIAVVGGAAIALVMWRTASFTCFG